MRRAALVLLLCPAAALGAPELFIEAELSPARVYIGEEARLVLRVLRAPGVPPGTLRPPRPLEAEVSLLGVRMYEERRDGVEYRVFERSNIVVPRRAGSLVIGAAEFESAAYFTEQFGRGTVMPRVARGPETTLEVMAPPPGAAEPFLPARALTLQESWSRDPDALSSGVPVTRTLTLRAEGLAAERLPRLEMIGDASVHVHVDAPELFTEYLPTTGMVGKRVQRIVVMPVAEGEVSLRELSVPWWDVVADQARVASLPGRVLKLHASVAPAVVAPPAPPLVRPPTLLRGFAAALLVLAAFSMWLYLRGQALRDARAKLKAACLKNDARGARDALIEWEAAAGVKAQIDRRSLDAALYAGRPWSGRSFWRAGQRGLRVPKPARAARARRAPFFRLQGA